MKVFFLQLRLLLTLILLGSVQAMPSYQILPGTAMEVNEFGICKQVENVGTYSLFVPTNDLEQWQAFIFNHPPEVNLADCLTLPDIEAFTVTDPFINEGGLTELNWNVAGGNVLVEIDNGVGSVLTTGSQTVSPTTTTTYTLTATNDVGSVDETVQVTVAEAGAAMCGDGNATVISPYLVTDCDCLQGLNTQPTQGKTYALTGDIDCSVSTGWNSGEGFEPIEDFHGTLDGRDHVVTGLFINRPNAEYQGLFSEIKTEGVIKNVELEGADITGGNYTAMLAADNRGELRKVSAQGMVDGQGYTIGGLVAVNNGDIYDAFAVGTVTGTSVWTGGLVGVNNETIERAYADVDVSGNGETGGFASNNNGTIREAFSVGDVSGSYYTGAFLGAHYSGVTQDVYVLDHGGNPSVAIDYGAASATSKTFAGYFYNASNEPLNTWDTTSTWYFSGAGYPTFRAVDPSSAAAPVITEFVVVPSEVTAGSPANLSWETAGTQNVLSIDQGIGTVSQNAGTILITPTAETTYTLTVTNPEGSVSGKTTVFIASDEGGGVCGDGAATVSDPYMITDCDCLQGLQEQSTYNKYYALAANVSCTDSGNWNGGFGFEPILDFAGTFDGRGYTITGLTINRPTSDRNGLFEEILPDGVVKNTRLVQANVTGQHYNALLVADNKGALEEIYVDGVLDSQGYVNGLLAGVNNYGSSISDAYSSGTLSATSVWSGGLVGVNNGTMSRTYSTADVSGQGSVGGLTGDNNGTISNSFAVGDVSGNYATGGLIGADYSGTVIGSHWLDHLENPSAGIGSGTDSTTVQTDQTYFYTAANFPVSGWDTTDIWAVDGSGYPVFDLFAPSSGSTPTPPTIQTYTASPLNVTSGDSVELSWQILGTEPVSVFINQSVGLVPTSGSITVAPQYTQTYTLIAQNSEGTVQQSVTVNVGNGSSASCGDGSGTAGDPYLITDCDCLQAMGTGSQTMFDHYRLSQNISCGETLGWNSGAGFEPLAQLHGSFDGNQKTISNLYINRPNTERVGLFARTSTTGEVFDLGLTNVNITGSNYTAGLVADHGGMIERSYVTGTVDAQGYVAGHLAGVNNGTVRDSYSTGALAGSSVWNGGLIGVNNKLVERTYSTVDLTGSTEMGGLVGNNNDRVYNSFATGSITGGTYNVGGVMGVDYATSSGLYWYDHSSNPSVGVDGDSSGGSDTSSSESVEAYFYTGSNAPMDTWDFTNVWQQNAGAMPTLR